MKNKEGLLQILEIWGVPAWVACSRLRSVSVETIYRRNLDEAALIARQRLNVPIRGDLVPSGEDLLVSSVPLLDLYAFLKAYRDVTEDLDRLYEKNVVAFLGIAER